MLSNEVVERLGELLTKATPGPWQSMNEYHWDIIIGDIDGPDDGDMHFELVTDITSHHDRSRANAALIAAAVNALPELLRVYRMWMEAPVEEMYHAGAGCLVAELVVPEVWAQLDGQRVRLVRDGDSGEGES